MFSVFFAFLKVDVHILGKDKVDKASLREGYMLKLGGQVPSPPPTHGRTDKHASHVRTQTQNSYNHAVCFTASDKELEEKILRSQR